MQDEKKHPLDVELAAALKASQLAWLSFRDRERTAIVALFADLDGTMYHPMRSQAYRPLASRRKAVARARAS